MFVFVLVLTGFLGLIPFAQAGAVVEGTVALLPQANAPVSNERYGVTPNREIATPEPPVAVIYLEGDFPPSQEPAGALPAAVLSQKDYQFRPSLLAIQKGTEVSFPNLDDDYHSIFSYSKSKRFDFGRYRRTEDAPRLTFNRTGVVKTYCEIHENMKAVIIILDTPYFVKSGADGRYRLEDLPAGNYTLKAWVSKKRQWETAVSLKDGETMRINFPPR